ncbi:hypothetical protein NE236_35130 [Actinoallomurus purpureus]|uniref:hypothetical protein n=1 Tax=Actinoallomurus purpureus TaxID=478114 RepID=UPI0020923168|nr:hypothetical protein [Actinoallomurus purpureus]MCO6010210.1 hypothetical protein [Actinoallomurus purpureus]
MAQREREDEWRVPSPGLPQQAANLSDAIANGCVTPEGAVRSLAEGNGISESEAKGLIENAS